MKSKPIAAIARLTKLLLQIDRIPAFQRVQVRPPRAGSDRGHKRHQLLAQSAQCGGDFGGLRARFEFIEQRIVRLIVVTNRRGFLPLQLDRPLQQRPEPREVVRLAGLDPQLLAQHRQLCQLFDQRLRQLRLPFVVALQVDDVGARFAVRIGGERAVDEFGQPLANFRARFAFCG